MIMNKLLMPSSVGFRGVESVVMRQGDKRCFRGPREKKVLEYGV